MSFDYERWKSAILASGGDAAGLLEATGLTDADYPEEDILWLWSEIDAERDETEQQRNTKKPTGEPDRPEMD